MKQYYCTSICNDGQAFTIEKYHFKLLKENNVKSLDIGILWQSETSFN